MVRVASIEYLDEATKKAKVSLEADTKSEMTGITTDDIIGYPTGYEMDFMSSVFTTSGEMAFLKSDGTTWNWGD